MRSLQNKRYHFSGVGGSGMAPLSQFVAPLGAPVTGSDRNLDRGLSLPLFSPRAPAGGAAVDLVGAVPPGSLRVGASDWLVVETDESDGSVAEFSPAIAVLTNLTRDHKEVEVTREMFGKFLAQTRERAVIHVGDPALQGVPRPDHLSSLTVGVQGDRHWFAPALLAK